MGFAHERGSGDVIRVLLAEDMHLIRGALMALLALEPDIEVVAEISSGDEVRLWAAPR
jgi:two-component system response regulator DesR